MSLMRTLVKVGIGIAVAKGVGAMVNRKKQGRGQGGIGGLLGGLAGGQGSAGLQDMMSNVLGGSGRSGAGLGGLLAGQASAGFGSKLNDAFARMGEPEEAPTADEDAMAGLMLRAMIQAAKSDGKIDDEEKQKLLASIADLGEDEQGYVTDQLSAPIDIKALADAVPQGSERDIYVMSVMAIDLDNNNEAQYLHGLAEALQLDAGTVNGIHEQLGIPSLYS